MEVKYGGLDVSDAKRLRALEDENAKLKKLLAEAQLIRRCSRKSPQKNGDAHCQARSRCPSSFHVSGERAAGVLDARGRSDIGALPQQTA
jgi:hypothetical protein